MVHVKENIKNKDKHKMEVWESPEGEARPESTMPL